MRQRVQRLAPGVDVELMVGDLGSQAGVEALVAALDGREIDVLINNAGFGTYGRLQEIDADREPDLIAVNVDALVRLTHAVLPGMLARGHGQILNVASTIAFQPGPVSGHLRRLEGVRAVVQSGAVGRDARLGRQGDCVVSRCSPAPALSTRWMPTCRRPGSTSGSPHPNLLWPRDFGRSIADDQWWCRVCGTG